MKKSILVIFFASIFLGFSLPKKIEAKIDKEVKSVFKIESFTKQSIVVLDSINSTLPIQITDDNFKKISNENKLLGYYFFGRAYGKADYFDFVVILDKDLIVLKVKVLVYRENHGGEVSSKRWLKQFIGKDKNTSLKYQKNIAAISGATLSAKAMTREINKFFKTISILYSKQQL